MTSSASGDEILSVSDFVGRVLRWRKNSQVPVAFRGQGFTEWKTQPKIFRPDVGVYEHENEIIRELIAMHPREFNEDATMFDRLVRMQHFDLPTRLLDVTINPLVALYFACEVVERDDKEQDGKVQAFFLPKSRQRYFDSDRVSCMANLAYLTVDEKKAIATLYGLDIKEFNSSPVVRRLLWFIKGEKPMFRDAIDPKDLVQPVFVKPKMSNRRIIAQSGAFLVYGARRLKTKEVDADLQVSRMVVPANKKGDFRDQLERLGIHASSLFPEIDKAAGWLVSRYRTI